MAKFKLISFSKELPKKFKWVNYLILLSIIFLPIVFFGSIFISDNPKSMNQAYGLFLLVNSYPIFLFILVEINARIYRKFGNFGYIIPLTIIGLISFLGINEYNDSKKFSKDLNLRNQRRKEAGYLGNCNTYRIKNDTIFYKDEIINGDPKTFTYLSCHFGKDKNNVFKGEKEIVNSDAKSFEIVDWIWQKDKNRYYYRGEVIEQIDYESFEILELTYSKDKNNVYYGLEIVEEADPNSFTINRANGIGTDKLNSYKNGKKLTSTK